MILAGHGILLSGAMPFVRELAERAGIPVAMTLLGIGAFPASHPLNLGMMGMHGEAWVNTAIQEADLLIALGMRFDDRVTGNVRTYARQARRFISTSTPPRSARLSRSTSASSAISATSLGALVPGVEAGGARLDRAHRRRSRAIRRSATSRTWQTTAISMRRT